MKRKSWGAFWVAWGAVGIVVELVAVFRQAKGDTLSEQVWFVRDHYLDYPMAGFLMAGFFAWLVYHFVFEGRRNVT
jgi:hypothetical protein